MTVAWWWLFVAAMFGAVCAILVTLFRTAPLEQPDLENGDAQLDLITEPHEPE